MTESSKTNVSKFVLKPFKSHLQLLTPNWLVSSVTSSQLAVSSVGGALL